MNLKEKLMDAHKSHPTLTVAVLGGFTALTLMFSVFGAVQIAFAQAFEVCGAIGSNSAMAQNIQRLISFLIAAVFGGGTLLAAIEHAKEVLDVGSGGKKIWNSDKIKGAVGFPLGLYFIDFGLQLIFKVDVSCLFPW